MINFKNYREVELELSPKINCFVGNNGVGKTNILDAIYYLSLCKSYFNPVDSQNINYSEDFFMLRGGYQKDDKKDQVHCGIKRGKKKVFKRNQKEYTKLSDHIGLYPVVMISPADGNLISGGSDLRRRFINGVISQFNQEYLVSTMDYNKVVTQRNALLKQFARNSSFNEESLSVWDGQLVRLGQRIFNERHKLVDQLIPIFQDYYTFISGGNEQVELAYESHFSGGDFGAKLASAREKDKILQFSTVGVHKDDLVLNLDGYPIKKVGSQGQQKTYLVSLKLAKFEYIRSTIGYKPILLLDDIFDKFDSERVEKIIKLVADDNFGQIFITDTSTTRLNQILSGLDTDHRIFNISRDKIAPNKL